MSRNCPNCGAPLDDNYCKCPYCGTLYYDLTVLDDEVPCYIKFRTAMGTITTYAKPELKEINTWRDIDWNKKDKTLYTVDTRDRK